MRDLLEKLTSFRAENDRETGSLARIREFLRRSEHPFSRANPEGHVTASAVVALPGAEEFLLVWHRKLNRWLQPGGHLEPSDESVFAGALREAREETEMTDFAFPIGDSILDVDVHSIPAHGSDPAHFHYDIRHLLIARGPLAPFSDKRALFTLDQALAAGIDDSLARALRKATALLDGLVPTPTTYHPPPTTY